MDPIAATIPAASDGPWTRLHPLQRDYPGPLQQVVLVDSAEDSRLLPSPVYVSSAAFLYRRTAFSTCGREYLFAAW
jgi:hypothetical protein